MNSATAGTAASRSSGGRCFGSGRASGRRGSVRSHRRCSGSREVARTTSPLHVANRPPTSVAASSRCSKLSRTNRMRRAPRWLRVASSTLPSPVCGAPTARAMAAATRVGSGSGARSANRMSEKPGLPRKDSATATARRVLPTPPGPITVRSRTSSASTCARIVASSSSRPMSFVACGGRAPRP